MAFERAWCSDTKSWVWPFDGLAEATALHCAECREPVICTTHPESGERRFAHRTQTHTCKRHKATARRDDAEPDDVKYILLRTLVARGAGTLQILTPCTQCQRNASTTLPYTHVIDPFAGNIPPPPDEIIESGADVVLVCTDGKQRRLLGLRISVSTPRREEPAGSGQIRCVNVDWKRSLPWCVKALVDRDILTIVETETVVRCGHDLCLSSLELATKLGLYNSWSTDEVDWDAKIPDLSQYVANTSTGNYRVYKQWFTKRPPSEELLMRAEESDDDDARLMNEVQRRGKCLMCASGIVSDADSACFCVRCCGAIERNDYQLLPYESLHLSAEERDARNAKFAWLKSTPYLKKPTKNSQGQILSAPEKPCVDCGTEDYKPIFYYGYHALCSQCLWARMLAKA
jgi:hypothetical protein